MAWLYPGDATRPSAQRVELTVFVHVPGIDQRGGEPGAGGLILFERMRLHM